MSLMTCPECSKQFSTDAKTCPHCGKKRPNYTAAVIAACVGIFGLWAIMSAANSPDREPVTPLQVVSTGIGDPAEAARLACDVTLTKSLNDPDSAKMVPREKWYLERRKNGTFLIQPTGRAKNSFGAYMQGTWNCVVRADDKGIKVLSLKQITD